MLNPWSHQVPYIWVVLNHPVAGDLLQQPPETRMDMNQVLATMLVFRAFHGKIRNGRNIKEQFKSNYAMGSTRKYYITIKTLKYHFLKNKGWMYN